MPLKISNLLFLKQALTSIDKVHQGIAASIGLLAYSGLNHYQQMPEMCHLLAQLFKLKSCGYFWSDQEGNMLDAWCTSPNFLSFRTLMSCLEYQTSDTRAWPPFQENVLMGAGAGYLLPFQNERFYASPHYRTAYQPLNIKHILDVVLHDGTRPFGAFLLMRSAEQGPFTPDERSLLVKLIPTMNMALSASEEGEHNIRRKHCLASRSSARMGNANPSAKKRAALSGRSPIPSLVLLPTQTTRLSNSTLSSS